MQEHLDPLATGLMVVCTGEKTKTLNDYLIDSKVYKGELKLGATTPSFDLETAIDKKYEIPSLDLEIIHKVKSKFIGEQEQIPPIFSAKRIKGKESL